MALGFASAIPSTPGYVGVYQFVAVLVLVPFGLSRDQALVQVIGFQGAGYIVAIDLGMLAMWRLTRREDALPWLRLASPGTEALELPA